MKKVALVGNMNNNFFSLIRYLRDKNIQAELFLLNNEMGHFLPECDTYDLSHRAYTHTLNFGNLYWFLNECNMIKKDFHFQIEYLKAFDYIIACGAALGFLEFFDIHVNMFIPYGGDVTILPFYVPSQNPNHREHLDAFSSYQMQAIKNVDTVITTNDFTIVDVFADGLNKLNVLKKTIGLEYFPFIYHPIYAPDNIIEYFSRSYWANEFLSIRNSTSLLIISHVRHVWKTKADISSMKGNNLLIEAFAHICKEYHTLNPLLILFEYGNDIFESKKLIAKYGIEKFVIWMPQMNRKDIMVGLYYADLVGESFVHGNAMCGIVAESLISKTNIIKYTDLQYINGRSLYTSFNAKTWEQIFDSICKFQTKKPHYLKIAQDNFEWFERQSQYGLETII
ncbi:MAG: glycosyltransferase, partial [Helicobacter sp.]|nr:glycosyltransferase [Helicobacter sp.]